MRRPSTPGRDLGQDHPDLLGCHASSRLQRKAFTRVLINQTQPFQAPTVAGPIEDEVPCPDVILAARRPEVTGVGVLAVRPARLGIGPRSGQFQPQTPPDATHRLLVDRPALAIQQGPDPPIAVSRMEAGQFLDPPGQRRLFVADDRRIAKAGSGQAQRPRYATLRDFEVNA